MSKIQTTWTRISSSRHLTYLLWISIRRQHSLNTSAFCLRIVHTSWTFRNKSNIPGMFFTRLEVSLLDLLLLSLLRIFISEMKCFSTIMYFFFIFIVMLFLLKFFLMFYTSRNFYLLIYNNHWEIVKLIFLSHFNYVN